MTKKHPDQGSDARRIPVTGEMPGYGTTQETEPGASAGTGPAGAAPDLAVSGQLADQLAGLQGELAEMKDRYLRAVAEAENTRRRAEQEVANTRKYALETFANEIVTVRDNLERAQAWDPAGGQPEATVASVQQGVQLTLKQLDQVLERFGIRPVDPEPGEKLDPNLHQAMSLQPSPDIAPNHIVSVVQKGYTIHDRLLRPAMVIVSSSPAA